MRVDRLLSREARMARAYSQDLGDWVLAATAEGFSARGAAERFGVGIKTAIETRGRKQGHPKGSKLDEHEAFLLGLVAEKDDVHAGRYAGSAAG